MRKNQHHRDHNLQIVATHTGICEIHKRYKGKRRPRHLCAGCWALYLYWLIRPGEKGWQPDDSGPDWGGGRTR